VSENRKKLLLQHFGSIDKLRKATAEEIRQVEGVGEKLAGDLVRFFERMTRKPVSVAPEAEADGTVVYQLK
jgi:excinuclease ABC subunit C